MKFHPRDLLPGTGGQETRWALAAGVAAALGTLAVRRSLERGWKATGRTVPKNPADPDVRWGEALAWAAVSGLAVGLARVLLRRGVATAWRRRHPRSPARWRTG